MEWEVWLVKSFQEITKVERGHLKPNYGYLKSSLEISAFHYIVQETEQMTTQWRFVFAGILSRVWGWRAYYTANKSNRNSADYQAPLRARLSALINKSSFFICLLTVRPPRTFLQINGWVLILSVNCDGPEDYKGEHQS